MNFYNRAKGPSGWPLGAKHAHWAPLESFPINVALPWDAMELVRANAVAVVLASASTILILQKNAINIGSHEQRKEALMYFLCTFVHQTQFCWINASCRSQSNPHHQADSESDVECRTAGLQAAVAPHSAWHCGMCISGGLLQIPKYCIIVVAPSAIDFSSVPSGPGLRGQWAVVG